MDPLPHHPIVWEPDAQTIERSNVKHLLDRLSLATVEELRQRAAEDPAWFWGEVERTLGFDWFEPYEEVLDLSDGKPWAKWFVGGKTNIALNCVDRHAAGPRRNKLALIWEGEDGAVRRWTYRDLHAETSRLAGALRSMGVERGDTVGVYMPMLPETVAALLAICKIGAVFIPLFSGYGAEAVEQRLADAGARVLLTSTGAYRRGRPVAMKAVADAALAKVPSVEHVVVYPRLRGDDAADVPWVEGRDVWWADALADQPRDVPSVPMESEDPWMVIYTSGTTGRPKGAVHVHGGFLVKNAQEVAHQADLHDDDLLWWFTDMGWIMGPWEVVGGLALGGTLLLYSGSPDQPAPDRVWDVVERHGVTILGVSPTMIRALMKFGNDPVRKHDLSTLRVLGSTGEPWNPEPYRWLFDEVGGGRCPIANVSGGTEVGTCFLSPTNLEPIKATSLGRPSLGLNLAVLDDDGNPVPPGTVGELAALAPWPGMTRGLYKDPDRYLATYWSRWEGIWYHGDFASVDEDGFWYLHGRSDDTINVAGKRIGPAEFESAIVDTGKVVEAAAGGIPDAVKGEVVHVWCIPAPGVVADDELEAELKNAVAERLGKPFKPAGIHFVKDLPRTRNGKILRRGVRAKAMGKDPGDLSSLGNPEALEGIGRVG